METGVIGEEEKALNRSEGREECQGSTVYMTDSYAAFLNDMRKG